MKWIIDSKSDWEVKEFFHKNKKNSEVWNFDQVIIRKQIDEPVLAIGTINFIRLFQRFRNDSGPNTYCTFCNLQYNWYTMFLEKYLFNSNIPEVIRACDLRKSIDKLYKTIGQTIFIRPNSPCKILNGQLIGKDAELPEKEILDYIDAFVPNDELLFLYPQQTICNEYRMIVLNKEVIEGCQYIENGEVEIVHTYPENVLNFAKEIASGEFQPDIAYVLDIHLDIYTNKCSLVEVNGFSTASWYDCDLKEITDKVENYLNRDYKCQNK